MRSLIALALLGGCGRVGFEPSELSDEQRGDAQASTSNTGSSVSTNGSQATNSGTSAFDGGAQSTGLELFRISVITGPGNPALEVNVDEFIVRRTPIGCP